MSQFPSVPPPGTYHPPSQDPQQAQGYSQQQQGQQQQPHYGYQSTTYGAPAAGHNPSSSHKPTKAFGQVFNQAMNQGKPMLDKLGKTISSKLGNKPPKQPLPQHLQSYHSYQQHNQQAQPQTQAYQQNQSQAQGYQHNQPQIQGYTQNQPLTQGFTQNQPQAQGFTQNQTQTPLTQGHSFSPAQSVYQTPQQSPFAQSTQGTPASGAPGNGNYFPQQIPQASKPQQQQQQQYQQAPHQQFNNSSPSYGNQPQGQYSPATSNQNQPPGLPPQSPIGQASGQQTGVIGGSQPQSYNTGQQNPAIANSAANTPPPPEQPHQQQQQQPHQQQQIQPHQPQQQQWTQHQQASPAPQSPAPFESAAASTQHQWRQSIPVSLSQSPPVPQSPPLLSPPLGQHHSAAPPVPVHPNPQLDQESSQTQQQWSTSSLVSPQQQMQLPAPGNSPPPQTSGYQQRPLSATAPAPTQQQQQHPNQPSPPQKHSAPSPIFDSSNVGRESAPTEFVAELPADLGNLSFAEGSKSEDGPLGTAQYQPYRPTEMHYSSSGPGFTIPRRAVSTSSMPLADPWRFADPLTELPTREFYILADLIFDGMDRRYEPQNTGLLEASKVLESWRAQQLPEEAAKLFAHDSYSAFAKIWSLQSVPHVMVPLQPSLAPIWNFQRQTHSQQITLSNDAASTTASYATYVPALNRAGWYKYFFITVLHQPEELEKMLSTFCTDTYKPKMLNQPDLLKRDKNESATLVARATAISTGAVSRVCEEVVTQMKGVRPDVSQGRAPSGGVMSMNTPHSHTQQGQSFSN